MKIFNCKCMDCKAEFQAVLEDEKDKPKCPSCDKINVEMEESETQLGCGGGCGSCGSGCSS